MDPLSLPACWSADMVFLEALAPLGLGSPAPTQQHLRFPWKPEKLLRLKSSTVRCKILLALSPWRTRAKMLPQPTARKHHHSSHNHTATTQAWSMRSVPITFYCRAQLCLNKHVTSLRLLLGPQMRR